MSARRQCLGRWELGVLILCTTFVLLTAGVVGQRGRMRAKEVVCQANLSQWHDIFQDYIDPNGRFIRGDSGTPGYWWVKYLSEEHKDWKRTRIWFCPTASGPVVDEQGRPTQRLTIFNAWGVYQGTGLGPNGVSGSYGLNGYVIPIDDSAATSQRSPQPRTYGTGVPAKDGWQDLLHVPHGETVPMFIEALRFDLWPVWTNSPAADESAIWTSNLMARCCINRHDGAVNCLFVDGSVRNVGLKELWTLKWHQSFNTTGPWTRAGGVLPTDWPAWMRSFKEY